MKIRGACFVARAFPILLTSFLPFEASAQDACHDILTTGFYTEYAKSDAKVRDRSLYAELCSLNYEQAQAAIKSALASGDDGTLGLSFGLFALDDDGVNERFSSRAGPSRPPSAKAGSASGRPDLVGKIRESNHPRLPSLIQTAIPGKAAEMGARGRQRRGPVA